MEIRDDSALRWIARFFLAIGIGAAVACASSAVSTMRFISESVLAEGTVVDWVQGGGQPVRSPDAGAYHRVIEVESRDGRRLRGEAVVGVDIGQLRIGERVIVRYRPRDPTRMHVATLSGLWLAEVISGVLAVAFGGGGWFLRAQAKRAAR